MKNDTDTLGAGIIYRKTGKQVNFVLIKDRFDKWTFPKGKTMPKENIKTAVLRECSEETGLKRLEIKKFLVKIKYSAAKRNKIVYFFLVEYNGPNDKFVLDAKERIKQAVWKNSVDIVKLLGYNNFIPCFKKSLKHLKIPVGNI